MILDRHGNPVPVSYERRAIGFIERTVRDEPQDCITNPSERPHDDSEPHPFSRYFIECRRGRNP